MARALSASVVARLALLAGVAGVALLAACGADEMNDSSNADASTSSGAQSSGAWGVTTSSGGSSGEGGVPYVVPACLGAEGAAEGASELVDDPNAPVGGNPPEGALRARVDATGAECTRTFVLSTTAALRDANPSNPRTVKERADRPSVQTKSPLFDALYQLALDEADEVKVDSISDWSFNDGKPVACGVAGCFETGRKWNYVWTRDTAYAVDLGLGWVDPARAASSLDFKLSTRRNGATPEVVQDTGTGGSYPVSSDRVVWALGASRALLHLEGAASDGFAARALEALENTLAHDRAVVFDPRDGLYRGEQSFLDWRAQTYPEWTVPNLTHIAASKSLSTNVVHLQALQTAQALARRLGRTDIDHAAEIDALRAAIQLRFWLEDEKQYSTFVTTELDGAPARRYDLLGTSLAILAGVATEQQARDALSGYPTLPKGPPVVFPQQQDTPIYHNRAIWPFVTGYWMRAAKHVGHDGAYEAAARSLLRGAAMNLSNMENLEVVTGTAFVSDGASSGPVVNSQRQLWSVAAYLGMVNEALFGLHPAQVGGLAITPYVTAGIHRDLFGGATSVTLNRVPWRGKSISVRLRFPALVLGAPAQAGAYVVSRITLNGAASSADVAEATLGSQNLIEVELAAPTAAPRAVRIIADVSNYRVLFAPKTPAVGVSLKGGKLELEVNVQGESNVTYAVYRDGARIASGLTGGTWRDESTSAASPSHCYTIETRFTDTGNVSHRANPACYWGPGNDRITVLEAASFANVGGASTTQYGRTFFQAWGDPGHSLTRTFTAAHAGEHLLATTYGNGAGPLDTGISCAMKRIVIERVSDGGVVGSGIAVMPQRGDWASWGESTFVRATLQAGVEYRLRIDDDEDTVNMTGFSHFSLYTAGAGGSAGPNYRVHIADAKLLWLGR